MLVASTDFLIPNGTFIAEVIGFLIFIGVMWKWILPPLNRAMQKRQEDIRASLEAADEARKEASQANTAREEVLAQARSQAREIIGQANHVAEQLREEARRQGDEERLRMIESAKAEIELERQRLLDEVATYVVELVMTATEQVLRRSLDHETQRSLVEEAVEAARSATPFGGTGGRPTGQDASGPGQAGHQGRIEPATSA
jgi:F-type H+-transporting ATPase subunit b